MKSKETKIGILSEMIELAKADQVVKESEYNFLFGLSVQFGIHKEEFDELFLQPTKRIVFDTHKEQVEQFHRLIVLMNIDQEKHRLEVELLRVMGLRLGLKPSLVLRMLDEMNNYPNGMVPLDSLLLISAQNTPH